MEEDYLTPDFDDVQSFDIKPGFYYFTKNPVQNTAPLKELGEHHLTPIPLLYTRNHADTPDVEIEYFIFNGRKIFFDDLKGDYDVVRIESVLQCCGNRWGGLESYETTNFSKYGHSKETDGGMIGNILWTGIRILDLLPEKMEQTHIEFVSHDGYSNSIALCDLHEDCILAWEMNGECLTPEHGFPIRAILPGIIGAKSVKSIYKINLLDNQGDSPWASNYYHIGNMPCVNFPLNSIITNVNGKTVEGVAMGFGKDILEVRLCKKDDFESFVTAEIIADGIDSDNVRPWGWVRWRAEFGFDGDICVYCIDVEGNVQPLNIKDVWNIEGYMNNAPHIYTRK